MKAYKTKGGNRKLRESSMPNNGADMLEEQQAGADLMNMSIGGGDPNNLLASSVMNQQQFTIINAPIYKKSQSLQSKHENKKRN